MALKSGVKNILALGCGLLFILLLDFSLSVVGVVPLADEDPFVGFAGTTPLFLEDSTGRCSLNPAKASYFNAPQSFQKNKPPGTFRIVTLGGSTTYGRPYLQQTAFGSWLEKLIEKYSEQGDVEIINAGGISYASYRVRRLMQELSEYEPDLFVVYSGHNEFLEARTFADLKEESDDVRLLRQLMHHSRIYSVLTRLFGRSSATIKLGDQIDATLEQIGGPELYHRDPEFRVGVIRQYQHELNAMVRFSQDRNIPLVLATLPVNLSGISPFKSEYDKSLSSEAVQRLNVLLDDAEEALRKGEPELALSALNAAEEIDAGYALLHYRKGQALLQLGNSTKAYAAFDRARQEDIVPLRALNEFNQIIRSTAFKSDVALADVERFFLRVSPDHITGNNIFVDHVHPSIEGQQLIAWVIMNAATNARLLPLDAQTWQQNMPQARAFLRQELQSIPDRYQAMGLWGVGRLFFWAGKYPEAYVALKRAWQTVQDQPEMARQLAELEILNGDIAAALDYLDRADQLDPGNSKVALARASALNRGGRAEEAMALLQALSVSDVKEVAALNYLKGETLLILQRPDDAAGPLAKAVDLAPQVADYRFALAVAQKRAGKLNVARASYQDYLDLLPNAAIAVPVAEWLEAP